ncbi:cytochrome P450 [Kitasatospora sp. NPDC056783]|uniref:cytochrome P450 n=1 Tax=Kitasatospora sp. NPDC056783 TaxID=3345943 RepID=UPI00368AAEE0
MPTASRPPAPPVAPGRLPLIGHGLELWRRPLEFLDSLTAFDPIVATHLDPDRRLPDRPVVPRCAFLPFGAGHHLRIGESFARTEMTAVAATVAARRRLAPVPGAPVRGVMTSTNHPENLLLRVEPRTSPERRAS